MNNPIPSIRFTLYTNRAVMALIAGLVFALFPLLRWYNTVRILSYVENVAICAGFYSCVPMAEFALLRLDRLLRNIAGGQVFVEQNVSLLRQVSLCCGLVSLVCLASSFFYVPLIFLALIMAFLCPVINVVRQVLRAAIALREENDLTI